MKFTNASLEKTEHTIDQCGCTHKLHPTKGITLRSNQKDSVWTYCKKNTVNPSYVHFITNPQDY